MQTWFFSRIGLEDMTALIFSQNFVESLSVKTRHPVNYCVSKIGKGTRFGVSMSVLVWVTPSMSRSPLRIKPIRTLPMNRSMMDSVRKNYRIFERCLGQNGGNARYRHWLLRMLKMFGLWIQRTPSPQLPISFISLFMG